MNHSTPLAILTALFRFHEKERMSLLSYDSISKLHSLTLCVDIIIFIPLSISSISRRWTLSEGWLKDSRTKYLQSWNLFPRTRIGRNGVGESGWEWGEISGWRKRLIIHFWASLNADHIPAFSWLGHEASVRKRYFARCWVLRNRGLLKTMAHHTDFGLALA
jgi:hypothetical protein